MAVKQVDLPDQTELEDVRSTSSDVSYPSSGSDSDHGPSYDEEGPFLI